MNCQGGSEPSTKIRRQRQLQLRDAKTGWTLEFGEWQWSTSKAKQWQYNILLNIIKQ